MFYIDTHAHLYSEEFNQTIEDVVSKAKQNGVDKLLLPNVDIHSIEAMLKLEERFKDICYPMMGLHPTYVKDDFERQLIIIKEWLYKRKFIAVGEIGIDLYWDKTFLKEQIIAFETQIEWAIDLNIPIVIHARNSFIEIFDILDKYQNTTLFGLFHSFSGGVEEVQKILSYQKYMIALNGIVTFKNSKMEDAIKTIGLNHLVLETDSPYLTPHPYRGQINSPDKIPLIAEKIASVLNCTSNDVAYAATKNTLKLFKLE